MLPEPLPHTPGRIPAHVLSQKMDEEMVLLNTETGAYFGLTPVASRAWELLAAGTGPAAMPELLAREFDAAPERIASDLSQFFDVLRARQLVSF